MATWPTTKAATTHLDANTDSPAQARADLKTNVDNVNSIIDMFNITSPSNEQILKYNTTNSRFELGTAGGGGYSTAFIEPTNLTGTVITGNLYRQSISELADIGNIISITSNQFTLTAGTYSIEMLGTIRSTTAADQVWYFRNVTDNIDVLEIQSSWPSTGNFSMTPGGATVFTIAATKTFEFRFNDSAGNEAIRSAVYKITKYS